MKKYYVMPKDAAGQIPVIDKGIPVNMTGVIVVELPDNNGYLHVISRNKDYPSYKIAQAIAYNQITLADIK